MSPKPPKQSFREVIPKHMLGPYREVIPRMIFGPEVDTHGNKVVYTPAQAAARDARHLAELTARRRAYFVKSKYGLEREEYEAMLQRQGMRCMGCNRHEHDLSRKLCVDHNHTTRQVRGLLCHACNHAIGLVKENPDTLDNLANYLEYYAKQETKVLKSD